MIIKRIYSYIGFAVFWFLIAIVLWAMFSPISLIDKLTGGLYSAYQQADYANEYNLTGTH